MKSRKLGFFGKRRELRRSGNSKTKALLRTGLVESLEKRELLVSDWNPTLVDNTGFFLNAAARDQTLAYINAQANGTSGGGGSRGAEGGPNDIVTISEVEPNNGFSRAQLIPLSGNFGVNLVGTQLNNVLDEDWAAFDLQAGDILDVRLTSNIATAANVPLLSLYNSSNREMAATIQLPIAPADSPLAGSPSVLTSPGDIAVHYVIPTAGRYYTRLSDVGSSYSLLYRTYRPVLESAPVGTQQTIFLDFDGAIVNRAMFGAGAGSARMSAVSTYLAQYGIQAVDEDAFIDEVVRRVQAKFDYLGSQTNNPNYGVRILNSKDHADPWGEQFVSRVVVGGTWQELIGDPAAASSGVLGIAQSVDPGNFDLEETAIVMNDVLIATVNNVPITASAPRLEAIAELMTFVIVHEAGHFLGGWHQDPNSSVNVIMDRFYDEIVSSGSGQDGIFGTIDDVPIQFGIDAFSGVGGIFELGGINDTIAWLGWGLSSGTSGGTITGTTFNDRNANRSFDSADARLPGVRVFSDANNDGTYTAGEQFTFSDSNGDYRLLVTPGTHTIRQVTPAGYTISTPTTNSYSVNVALNQTVTGRNFGSQVVNQSVTGTKWNDIDSDGLRDAGEPGIGGVWIYIDLDGDNRIDLGEPSTQTAADGTYRLTFPGAGTYQVREVLEPGFVQTFPGVSDDANSLNDYEHEVILTGNPSIDASRIVNLNFGNRLTVDYGDLPATFGSASHGYVDGLYLGTAWDAEQSSQFSSLANGDDTNGVDDEDGVTILRPIVRGSSGNQLTIAAVNVLENTAYLNVWMDFNGDGTFGSGEQVATNRAIAVGTTAATTLTFAVPGSAILGSVGTRVRLSSTPNTAATGGASAGEVEDYFLTIIDTLELAVNDQFTVARNSVQNSLPVLANDFKLVGETVRVVSVSATSAGGTAQIAQDGQSVIYTPRSQFVGQDVFSYVYENSAGERDEASVTVDVRLVFADPRAIDDSFNVATNVIDFPLNILANDIEGPGGALSVLSVTQPDKGGQITIGTGGKSLRYTPPRGFGGTEFFSYTVGDTSGEQSSASVTIHTLPGDLNDDNVEIRLVATDLSGNPISAIEQGESFKIKVQVDDLRFSSTSPGVDAGVYAAYFDLLYSAQLVTTAAASTPGSTFNFDVNFTAPYTNVRRGDASIPGIINELGAVSSLFTMNSPDALSLADITFIASSPGIANFMPDPAEDFPDSDTLLFNISGSAVPLEQIRFTGTSLEVVGDGVEFPVALDDSVPDPITAATATSINVLANDRPGSTGVISIVRAGGASNGTVSIDTRGTASPADDRVVYTSNLGFAGDDQFTYTIADTRGIESTATVTLRVGAQTGDIVNYRLAVTDLNGTPIQQVSVGTQFLLTAFVQDLRTTGQDLGIFAAYQDILYSASMVSTIASSTNNPDLGFQITFGAEYNRVQQGDNRSPGLLNEVGAITTDDLPLGTAEYRLFSVPMIARSVGRATFISDPADVTPLHDTLTYEPVQPVPYNFIRFGSTSVNIVSSGNTGDGEFTNWSNRMDVNADGYVSPIDILAIVNSLNKNGPGYLSGEGEPDSKKMFVDTNADGMVSAIDILLVINHLNSNGGLSGEGEGMSTPVIESGVAAATLSTDLLSANVELSSSTRKKIGIRNTYQQQGPSFSSPAADQLFADDDDEMDDLLATLAEDSQRTFSPFA